VYVLGVAPLTVSQACYVCAKLSGIRLLLTEGGHTGLLQRIRLNVSQDDVLFALRDSVTKKSWSSVKLMAPAVLYSWMSARSPLTLSVFLLGFIWEKPWFKPASTDVMCSRCEGQCVVVLWDQMIAIEDFNLRDCPYVLWICRVCWHLHNELVF